MMAFDDDDLTSLSPLFYLADVDDNDADNEGLLGASTTMWGSTTTAAAMALEPTKNQPEADRFRFRKSDETERLFGFRIFGNLDKPEPVTPLVVHPSDPKKKKNILFYIDNDDAKQLKFKQYTLHEILVIFYALREILSF